MIKTKLQIIEKLEKAKDDDLFEFSKKQEKSLRSYAQCKYYFSTIVKIISQFHGYNPVETHELIKITVGIETTTDLSTGEFKFMIDMIRDLWKSKYDVYIPEPNEIKELENLQKYF